MKTVCVQFGLMNEARVRFNPDNGPEVNVVDLQGASLSPAAKLLAQCDKNGDFYGKNRGWLGLSGVVNHVRGNNDGWVSEVEVRAAYDNVSSYGYGSNSFDAASDLFSDIVHKVNKYC